jgi:hypothetical protein
MKDVTGRHGQNHKEFFTYAEVLRMPNDLLKLPFKMCLRESTFKLRKTLHEKM